MTTPKNALGTTIWSSHPVFEANQVLSFRALEATRNYLDQQSRLTRVCLNGAGNICGLVPTREGNKLRISNGTGVTTEGFLIMLEDTVIKHYREIKLKRSQFTTREDDTAELTVSELLEGEPSDATKALADEDLNQFFKDKIVVLLLEDKDQSTDQCIDNCDKEGSQRSFNVRKLLLKTTDVESINGELFELPGDTLFNRRFDLPELHLLQFGTWQAPQGEVKLEGIKSYETFNDAYEHSIEGSIDAVIAGIEVCHRVFEPIFANGHVQIDTTRLKVLRKAVEDGQWDKLDLQYVWAYLGDLIRAYDELLESAFDIMDVCHTDFGWFPRHLMLGEILAAGSALPVPPSPRRTPHLQPWSHNSNRARVYAANMLYRRLTHLTAGFKGREGSQGIRISPSRWSNAPLGERAIPFYYKDVASLQRQWNPRLSRRNRAARTFGYGVADHPDLPPALTIDLEDQDFYRIEGHVGRSLASVTDELNEARVCHNLPFDVVYLKLGEDPATDADCELDLMQIQYQKIRGDLICEGTAKADILPAALDDFDLDDFNNGDSDRVCSEIRTALEDLSVLFDARKAKVLANHVFHRFAVAHPGMAHRGGAPRGGTFIVVYTEQPVANRLVEASILEIESAGYMLSPKLLQNFQDQLTSKVVVGDFCLPYLCCSDCPPAMYVMERQRPMILLDRTDFCRNDATPHAVTVVPPGGVLEGLGTDNSNKTFKPEDAHVGGAGDSVTLRYVVNNDFAELEVSLHEPPDAGFEVPMAVCSDSADIPLEPVTGGGTFTVDNVEIPDSTFRPRDVPVDPDMPMTSVTIKYTVTDEHDCTSELMRDVRVVLRPDDPVYGVEQESTDNDRFAYRVQLRSPAHTSGFRYAFELMRGTELIDSIDTEDTSNVVLRAGLKPASEINAQIIHGPCVSNKISKDLRPVIERRRDIRIAALNDAIAIRDSSTFARVSTFLDSSDVRPDKVADEFEDVVDKFEQGFHMVSDENKASYKKIAMLATETMLDRLAFAEREPSDEEVERIKTALNSLRAKEIVTETISPSWRDERLGREAGTQRLDKLTQLFG